MNDPIISVIVPCYNQAQYIDECLQSVFDQTYGNWECIIVNDGSPDNTEAVAQKWVEKDARFRYLYKENGGLSSARNAGIEVAKGEWILPLDADDKISQNYLQLASLEFENGFKVIYSKAEYFGELQGIWDLKDFSLYELAKHNIIFCTAFFRKEDWILANGYDENLLVGLEDWDFWISLLKNGDKVFKINKVCFFYRIKKESMLTNLDVSNKKDLTKKYIYKKHYDFFVDIFETYDSYENYKSMLLELTTSNAYKIFIFLSKFFNYFKR